MAIISIDVTIVHDQYKIVAWRGSANYARDTCVGVKRTYFVSRVPSMRKRMLAKAVKAEKKRLAALQGESVNVTLD